MIYYKYQIFCTTDNRMEYVILEEGQPAPTTCPTDTSHAVNLDTVSIVQTIDTSIELVDINVPKTTAGIQKVAIYEPEGDASTVVSHNYADKCSWYQGSLQVVKETLTDSGDGLTFNSANTFWIDLENGRLYDEDNIMAKCGYKYKPKIYVNDVLQTNGYTINPVDGKVTFTSSQTGQTVKATYHKAHESYFALRPWPIKRLQIRTTEIQFSHDTDINGHFAFEAWFVLHPVYGTMPVPGTKIVYKNAKDFINACNGGQGLIPSWGELTQDVHVFPFEYARPKPIFGDQFLEIRVYKTNDEACGGEFSTCTFYITTEPAPTPAPYTGVKDMITIHGIKTFDQEYTSGQYVDLVGIPANARVARLTLRGRDGANGYVLYSDAPGLVTANFKVGTNTADDVFSNDDQQGNPVSVSGGPWSNLAWHKETAASLLRLTFTDDTADLTGEQIEYFIEYQQE